MSEFWAGLWLLIGAIAFAIGVAIVLGMFAAMAYCIVESITRDESNIVIFEAPKK